MIFVNQLMAVIWLNNNDENEEAKELITSSAYYFVDDPSSVCCISVRRSPVQGAAYPAIRLELTILRIFPFDLATVTFLSAFSP